jgi:ribosome maturation factor RimP
MNLLYSHALPCALLLLILEQGDCFSTHPTFTRVKGSFQSSNTLYAAKKGSSSPTRSRVSDPTGPTPEVEELEPETIALKDIPELKYDPNAHPIAHQPWRRGETAGCEDPIDAEWRVKAEEIMKTAVHMVGGSVLDVTWFLTACLVTIDEDNLDAVQQDFLKANGPPIELREPVGAIYKDPTDPSPEDIWADQEDAPIFERDEQAEFDLKRQMYARKADDEEELELDDDTDIPLYTAQETRGDDQLRVAEEAELMAESAEKPVDMDTLKLDTSKLSTIAGAILDALETVEEELKVLSRHEIVLTSPGSPDVLETQSQFDEHRGYEVIVETQDPWESNRTLRGKLVDRNSMDIIMNQKGRMVTVPLNFVKCVRLKQAINSQDYDAEQDAAYDVEQVEADDEGEVEYEEGEIDYEE